MLTNEQVIERIEALLAEMKAAPIVVEPEPEPEPTLIQVKPGDNLAQMILDSDGTKTFSLPPEFLLVADRFDIAKPCTLMGEVNLEGRAVREMPAPRFQVGQMRMLAPDVTVLKVLVDGTNRDVAIVEAGERTRITQVAIDGGELGARRGILTHVSGIRIHLCSVTNIFHREDAQAVVGWDGTKDLQVTDSLLEASGENVMFGGGDPLTEEGTPQDILIDGCTLSKPLTWRGRTGITVKNVLELKNAKRVTVTNNLLDGCWRAGQDGYAIVLTVRNQDGRAPWSTIEDVSIIGNTIRNCSSGVQILGRDDRNPSGRMTNVTIAANSFNLDPRTYGGRGAQFFVSGGPDRLTLQDNSGRGDFLHSFIYFDQAQYLCDRLVIQDNDVEEGSYGLFSSSGLGTRALNTHAPGYTWMGNRLRRTQSERYIGYPSGTTVIPA